MNDDADGCDGARSKVRMRVTTQDAIERVLRRLGIQPDERMGPADQDAEYTACRCEELDSYIDLYALEDIEDDERVVLGCFILEEGLAGLAPAALERQDERDPVSR